MCFVASSSPRTCDSFTERTKNENMTTNAKRKGNTNALSPADAPSMSTMNLCARFSHSGSDSIASTAFSRSASISSNSDMDALLEDQREARPAADRGAETRKPAGAGSRRSCPFRPHPSFRWIAPGYGVGLRGVSSTPLLMLEKVVLRLRRWCQRVHFRGGGTFVMPRTATAQSHVVEV